MERWDLLCTTETMEAFLLYRELIKYTSQSKKTEQLLLVWSGAQCVLAFSQTRLGGCCSEHEAGAFYRHFTFNILNDKKISMKNPKIFCIWSVKLYKYVFTLVVIVMWLNWAFVMSKSKRRMSNSQPDWLTNALLLRNVCILRLWMRNICSDMASHCSDTASHCRETFTLAGLCVLSGLSLIFIHRSVTSNRRLIKYLISWKLLWSPKTKNHRSEEENHPFTTNRSFAVQYL